MSKVFFGGSRKVGRISPAIRTRLKNIIKNQHTVLIGDANGADKAVQSFFAEEGYNNVIVYCMDGVCRNNVGNWQTKSIDSKSKIKNFAYYAMKDTQLSMDADYGFMIWDGESKGTLNNVLNLVHQDKSTLVYRSPSREFIQIKTLDDAASLVAGCPPELIDYLNKKINLEKRVASTHQVAIGF